MGNPPRIAIGGFMLESNSHAPLATREEFEANLVLGDNALAVDMRAETPRCPRTVTGFVKAMDESGPWTPVPTILANDGASGSCEQEFLDWYVAELIRRLKAAMPLDGIFLSQHGAADATGDVDPDGTILRKVREAVGPNVPVVATLDLHANVSAEMVKHADVLVSYRENPHTDMAERGADCARHLRAILGGLKPHASFQKLPLAPPSVTQGTKSGPYRDIIDYGQTKLGDGVIDVSVLSGFTTGDTPKNGLSVIVTADSKAKADAVARDVAAYAWAQRERFVPRLTSLEAATELAVEVSRDFARPPLLFADVADNPGGGGRGNTTYILKAFYDAGVADAALGPFFDPPLAAEAHRLGEGAVFEARFNRDETQEFSQPFTARAGVVKLSDGKAVARRGLAEGRLLDTGPSALIDVGGIRVAVVSIRQQALDPVYFEMFGIELAKLRVLVVKSRGHFRAAFDEDFSDDRIFEVDVPGLTTPVLSRVPWRRMPRPMYPLDTDVVWRPA
jgi:microcystin degradation protein MlrC